MNGRNTSRRLDDAKMNIFLLKVDVNHFRENVLWVDFDKSSQCPYYFFSLAVMAQNQNRRSPFSGTNAVQNF